VTAMLASFLTEGVFDEARFLSAATSLLMKAGSAAMGKELRIAVCGDGASTFGREGKTDAAVRVEQLWDQLARTYNIDVLCGYMLPGPATTTRMTPSRKSAQRTPRCTRDRAVARSGPSGSRRGNRLLP
jgi:hypothetical protein